MPDPAAVFAIMCRKIKVAVPVAELADALAVHPLDHGRLADLDESIDVLEASGLLCRWDVPEGQPTAFGHAGPVVTLSALSAARLGRRLNARSTRWVDSGRPEKPVKLKRHPLADGTLVLCESDMAEEPPGRLANVPAKEPDRDPDLIGRKVLAEEKRLGLVRPTLPLVGVRPHPVPGQSTAPIGPAYLEACGVDARKMKNGDAAQAAGDHGRRAPGSTRPCGLCGGRELRAMTTLMPARVAKSGAIKPSVVVDGGEACTVCGRHWLDSRWPRVRRPADDPKPREDDGNKGKPTRKQRRARERGERKGA